MGAPFKYTAKQVQVKTEIARTAALFVLLYGGSRSGKTFFTVMIIVKRALRCPGSRHAMARRSLQEARTKLGSTLRDVFEALGMVENVHYLHRAKIDTYEMIDGKSTVVMIGLDTRDGQYKKVLGDEYSTIYVNEANDIMWEPIEYAMSRLAEENMLKKRFFFDCNPPSKAHWLFKFFFLHENPLSEGGEEDKYEEGEFFVAQMNPIDNTENLADGYIERTLKKMSKKNRTKFLHGEFGEESTGKVFESLHINANRIHIGTENADSMRRRMMKELDCIIVAVDPNVTSKPGDSDECGIIVAGLERLTGQIYILEDLTTPKGPDRWPKIAAGAVARWNANYVVAESNQGGDLVKICIKNVDNSIPVTMVHAKSGKFARAEPVAELYELGHVHHVGTFFEKLEDEMVDFDPETVKQSPNRMDALVYAVLDLNRPRSNYDVAEGEEEEKHDSAEMHEVMVSFSEFNALELIEDDSIWN